MEDIASSTLTSEATCLPTVPVSALHSWAVLRDITGK